MEHRIEAYVVNWQNKFNGGESHRCSSCGKTIYLNKTSGYKGICPACGKKISVLSADISDGLQLSTGSSVGIGKRKVHRKHLMVFLAWWLISVVAGFFVSGLPGIALSFLFNVLLTIIGFRAFTYEIYTEPF
jgi:predicted RNA-binding Zn-ribbon protein involved in translation (DUF1610 family)